MTRFQRIVAVTCMVTAPLCLLASAAIAPPLGGDARAQLATVTQHSSRYYTSTLLILLGTMLLVPVVLGLMQMLEDRAPVLARIGSALALLGVLVALCDAATQLVVWQMATPDADPGQMAALLDRFNNSGGSAAVFIFGGPPFVVGFALLGFGLQRARVLPAWCAAGLAVGPLLNVAGFGAQNLPIVIASWAVLLVALGRAARRLTSPVQDEGFAMALQGAR